ncbi:ABC transporter ATP-binding protein [Pseudonocardia acidicola]|uniref:ABC transporter ATP-binding protein n=1 Tax=Pseudonocardia acidicola TaxID=2724939 RepID=A0ABX1SJE9_9PSEU|nr:ABC transporter ATP-binding protein [Pseudonocardia acidicola]NMI01661.1 ABC transporter ATP-binding protein [Pseudonocardia acidicola]
MVTTGDGNAVDARSGILVECVAASRAFGVGPRSVDAVRGASCVVPPGVRVALTGPSGSGKSTLLHLLAGLETPTSGSVSWPGLDRPAPVRPGTDGAPRRSAIGVVFQGPSLIPALDVIENVALPLLLAGVDENEAVEAACLALDRLRIGGLGPKLPEELSGGQAQRVAVARVLARRPRLILADEPTGQLDHEAGDQVVSVLLEAADELDAALVVSTHDPRVAARLRDRWQMTDGRLTVTPDDLPGSAPVEEGPR